MSIAELIAMIQELVTLLTEKELEKLSHDWCDRRDKVVAKAEDFLETQE
jgi:hypothetical protein